MRELKILAVVVVLTLITYWGIEPFAYSQMYSKVKPADYEFKDVDGLNGMTGDAQAGAALVQANCTACHSIQSQGFPQALDNATAAAAYGVVPPDLSSAGMLYNPDFLAAFIKDPVKASKVGHKYKDGAVYPMPGYSWMQPQEIADMVAYLQSIAPESMTNKQVFENACQRCHGIKYGDMLKGSMAALTPDANISAYMGKMPPDLSQFIRSKSVESLHKFINDPQGGDLAGTAMPRVGLTEEAEKQVIAYMTEVGDSSKSERSRLGPIFLIYLTIFTIFAFLWKAKMWRDVH